MMKPPFIPEESLKHPNFIPGIPQFSDIVGYLFSDIVGYLFSDIVGYLVSDIVGYLYLNFQIPWSVKRRLPIPFNQASALSATAALGHITPGGQLQPLPAWPRVPW
jgi:hypothetical protein